MCATSTTRKGAHAAKENGEGKPAGGEKAPPRPPQRGLLCLSPFAILLLSAVLESAALALILPAYPRLCKELGIDLKMRGWMISAYSFLQFLVSPLLGRASDVVGRTTMLRISAMASVASYAAMLLARDPWTFMLGRVLPGLLKCGIAVSQAYITDISASHDRAKNLGILGSSYGVAFVIGPAAGGLLMRRDLRLSMQVALAATLLNVAVLMFLPEPAGNAAAAAPKKEEGGSGTTAVLKEVEEKKKAGGGAGTSGAAATAKPSFWYLLRHSHVSCIVAVLLSRKLCISFASGLFETTMVEYCSRHLGLDGHMLGLILSYLGVLSVVNNTLIIRRLSAKYADSQLLLPAALGQTTALALWSYVHDVRSLLAVLAMLSVSGSILSTALTSQLSKATPHELTGSVLGVSYAIETFAKILTPPLGGYLLDQRGPHSLGWASVLFLLPVVGNIAWTGRRRAKRAGGDDSGDGDGGEDDSKKMR